MKNYKKTIRDFEKKGEKGVRTLKDLENYFLDKKAVQETLKKKNKTIYELFTKEFSPIKLTLTEVLPGVIGKEYYLTKGHVHARKIPEFYVLLEGKGILLIQKGKPREIKLKKGEIALIPEGYAHRLVNTGNKKLKVLTIYHEDSKPDYKIRFKKRFFKK